MIVYEDLLNREFDWALREGSMHFEEKSAVHQALRKITRRLDELGIPYAIADGMALFFHGYRRFTDDVDILVTPEGLQRIHEALDGFGYVPPFSGSKHLRDTEHGVRIEFLVTGQYPGDGKPKPIAFPNPADINVEIEGMEFLNLVTLIELKLVSGMVPGRRKDLGDVQELIRIWNLSGEVGEQLDLSVRELYRGLWSEVQSAPPPP